MQIQLPKLKKVNQNKKKKIFLISDSLQFYSGVATISKEIVLGTIHKYDWVQLGAALNHPDHGKILNLSEEVSKETGVDDAYLKIYCHNGYGNPDVLREIIMYEQPDALMLVTDPRFFGHVFHMEHELKTRYKIPIIYLNIWDNLAFPIWNSSAYASCDLLMSINKQTKVINKAVLSQHETEWVDLDTGDHSEGRFYFEQKFKTLLSYVPHGSSVKYFYKQTPESHDWNQFQEFKSNFLKKYDTDFIVFFNSRNIRRKQPGDIILSFKRFCDQLPKDSKKPLLLMKTTIQDENGTDLMAVKNAIAPKENIVFIQDMISPQQMNWFYNLVDCTFFMSSAEGFGLAANESLLCGTMIIAPVTGGLQDQMRFETSKGEWLEFDEYFTSNHRGTFKKCGNWAYPIFPRTRALQGSIPTPYIFDDYSDADDAATGLKFIYDLGKEKRDEFGLEGRDWVMSEESGMSSPEMCKRVINSIEQLFQTWTPKLKYELIKVHERHEIILDGIVW